MANPLKILTVLTASQAAKFEQGLDVNSQKVTNVAAGTVSTDGVNYGQLTDVSGAIKSYVDAGNSAQDAATSALSGAIMSALSAEALARIAADSALSSSMKSYVDAGNSAQDAATSALSGAVIAYVNAGDTQLQNNLNSVSSSIVAYVDAENDAQDLATAALSGALVAYIDAENAAQDLEFTNYSSSIKAYVDAQDLALSGAFDARLDFNEAAFDTLVSSSLPALSASFSGAVAAERTRALAAEGVLDARITTVSGAIVSYVDAANAAQDAATTALSGAIKTYVDAQDNALSSSLQAYTSGAVAAEAAARAAEDLTFLKLDGTRTMSGELKMGGQDIVGAKSGSFSGDVTVGGNLTVNGQLTYVNSVNLEVTDKLVTIAKGAANGAAADGAGIEVDGAGVSFVYDNAAGKWVSDIGLDVAGEASFDGAMKLSGSAFSNITTPVVDGKFDVSDAIHALDTKFATQSTDLSNKYDALRCVVTGALTSGQVIVNLTTEGGAQFAVAQIANIALDVMVDADNTGYTNDLVAIKMYVDGAALKVQIDAPATPTAAFRLIAVNEKDGGLV